MLAAYQAERIIAKKQWISLIQNVGGELSPRIYTLINYLSQNDEARPAKNKRAMIKVYHYTYIRCVHTLVVISCD